MKTSESNYVTISERVDKAIKKHGVGGDVYRNHYRQQFWRAMMLKEIECVRIDDYGRSAPAPSSRKKFWKRMPDNGRHPASVRTTPPDAEPPWKVLADMSIMVLDPTTIYAFESLGVSEASIEIWENHNLVPPPGSDDVKAQRSRNLGGAPELYHWDEFYIRIIEIAQTPDGLSMEPGAQAKLIRTMLQWCEDNWGRQPAQSTVKERISKLYRQLKLASN